MRTVTNTLEQPAQLKQISSGACLTAPRSRFNADHCVLVDSNCAPVTTASTAHARVCGSPGEVAHDPLLGHQGDVGTGMTRHFNNKHGPVEENPPNGDCGGACALFDIVEA